MTVQLVFPEYPDADGEEMRSMTVGGVRLYTDAELTTVFAIDVPEGFQILTNENVLP